MHGRAFALHNIMPVRPVGSATFGQSQAGTIMLETYFPVSKMPEHLRSGPSGPYLDGFAAVLARQGYSADTAVSWWALARTRQRSSLSETSRTWWSLFSMPNGRD